MTTQNCHSERSEESPARFATPSPFLSHLPHLDTAEHHVGWSLGHVATEHPNLTGMVTIVARARDKLLIDVQVDITATCNDRQRIDLVQTRPDEGGGALFN